MSLARHSTIVSRFDNAMAWMSFASELVQGAQKVDPRKIQEVGLRVGRV